MKTTLYFDYTGKRPDRAQIKEDWIKTVIEKPEKVEIQSDGRIRKWAKIPEAGKCLRVILIEDGKACTSLEGIRPAGYSLYKMWCQKMERSIY